MEPIGQMEAIPADFSAVPVDSSEALLLAAHPLTVHTDLMDGGAAQGKVLVAKRGKASFATIGEGTAIA